MLPEGGVAVERLWKRFRTDRPPSSLQGRLRSLRHVRRPPGERWRWALRDVSLTIQPGESVGLIGVNGSGKSTLLKIITRVMYPYAGKVRVQGRVGALIEVAGGIHPELSGRENIYLYGSLLGLPRREVARRFDQIVDFAEVGASIDRQVKFYSSGMSMRLGFAVAAFLEPAVLLVDEVLAVGDASFQQRCLDRMREVLEEGTTLVFVSHDLAAVEATCRRAVWLREGSIAADGQAAGVLGQYRGWVGDAARLQRRVNGAVKLSEVHIGRPGGDGPVRSHGPMQIVLTLTGRDSMPASVFLGLTDGTGTPTVVLRRNLDLLAGTVQIRCDIRDLPLPGGRFDLWASVQAGRRDLLPWQPVASVEVAGPALDAPPPGVMRPAAVHVEASWQWARLPTI